MPTALLSVYDKTGIDDVARRLNDAGWRLVSSGGTAAAVAAAGVPVTELSELTGVPAILDHRVVTLHPKVHGGLLADPTNAGHRRDMSEYGIEPIDLVVSNLYPFEQQPSIEQIDIGGPAMVRAAAKNHAHVAVLIDPSDYDDVLGEIERDGSTSAATRRRLAAKAFSMIAAYDALIASWFDDGDPLPHAVHMSLQMQQPLRYGENPHQAGARYLAAGHHSWWDRSVQHNGKEMSYLNVYDTEAAWRLVHRFSQPACVIVKHANPCGVAVAADIATAYALAHACDPVSAFGGIVACNREVDADLAIALAPVFTEVVVAPSFTDAALAVFAEKKGLRVVSGPAPFGAPLDVRSVDGGLLVQTIDQVHADPDEWRVVTTAAPTAAQMADLVFANTVCAAVSSNAIVYARSGQAVGIGAGQQNRVDSARIAARRAEGRAVGGVCASDAFFPFRDGIDEAASAGVAAIVQPGGSVRDDEAIAAANEHGIAMVFTGRRHFRH
jgi:phosphoribosylaminoimidazolecarboxamide formyltransferase/IMP cyclohydrolase